MKALLKSKNVILFTASIFILTGSLSFCSAVRAGTNGIAMPASLTQHKPRQYGTSFAISVKSALYQLSQNKSGTLIDIRSPEEFKRLKIPGSLNVPLHFIKAKSHLKSSPVVLVNKGYGYSKLEAEGRRLKALGFKTSILDGGLLAWHRKGGVLVGDLFVLKEMTSIKSQEFFKEKDFSNGLIINLSAAQTEEARNLIPHAVHLPFMINQNGRSVDRFRNELIQLSAQKNKPFRSVLLFNNDGKYSEKLKTIMNKIELNTFYLSGGLTGYQKYLEGLLLSWKSLDSRTRAVSNCNRCGEKSEGEKN